MKVWEKKYNNHLIRIENYWNKEILLVDGEVQDETYGLTSRAKLIGRLPSGEDIKVNLGGNFSMVCILFIDNKKISLS
ncbi:hypothetical protein [Clostridium nigeriense]|uniref:hypothetical protein n=1 Tax=Clostridium nigeriense TaxID=1805470 RepID=UPI00082FCC01|nr:hypothetical protein [Clostridium nigeriense]